MKKYELTQYELVKVRVDHKPFNVCYCTRKNDQEINCKYKIRNFAY